MKEGCISAAPQEGGGEGPGTHGPAQALLGHCIAKWAPVLPDWTGVGVGCPSDLWLQPWSREASAVPIGGGHRACSAPPPARVPPLLTTIEARMGTWMIHFLFPELKSQHLGRPRRQLPLPIPTLEPAHRGVPQLVCSHGSG